MSESKDESQSKQANANWGGERWHGISDKTLHRLGNVGIITYQALLFFVNNFSVTIATTGVQVSETVLNVGKVVFVILGLMSVIFYYLAADRKSPITSSSNKPAVWLALLAGIFAISVIPLLLWTSDAEHAWLKLFMGTACQFFAGCIGWKAANLIPAPSSDGDK